MGEDPLMRFDPWAPGSERARRVGSSGRKDNAPQGNPACPVILHRPPAGAETTDGDESSGAEESQEDSVGSFGC